MARFRVQVRDRRTGALSTSIVSAASEAELRSRFEEAEDVELIRFDYVLAFHFPPYERVEDSPIIRRPRLTIALGVFFGLLLFWLFALILRLAGFTSLWLWSHAG